MTDKKEPCPTCGAIYPYPSYFECHTCRIAEGIPNVITWNHPKTMMKNAIGFGEPGKLFDKNGVEITDYIIWANLDSGETISMVRNKENDGFVEYPEGTMLQTVKIYEAPLSFVPHQD